MLTGRFNLKNTCNYRRDSPCVALRVAVGANEFVHLGASSHPSNDDDCLHGIDGNGLKTNRQSAHFGDCEVSVSKIISKKIPHRPKNIIQNLRKKIKNKKFAGSIIGPAMAGPTGPFATALPIWRRRIEAPKCICYHLRSLCVLRVVISPFHSGCFGSASSELAKGAIAYRFHSEKLIRSLVN